MPDQPRPIRDILAESAREARLGRTSYTWASLPDHGQEEHRREADRLIRLLEAQGVRLARVGDPEATVPAPTSPVISETKLFGKNGVRLIRKSDGDSWQSVIVADGAETVEFTFTMQEVTLQGALVLTDDPEAMKIKGLGRLLAAQNEIYRAGAEGMGRPA